MPYLLELTAQIVSAHIYNKQMTSNEIQQELQKVHESLKVLEAGSSIAPGTTTSPEAPMLTIKQAFKKNEVICMICGKGGNKTLKRHLTQAHQLTPRQYRKQFGIPSTQNLTAKSYSKSRRQTAIDNNLADGLAKAREKRKMDKADVPMKTTKAPVPAVKVKAAVPAVKKKAAVPTVKVKAPVPAVKKKAAVPAKVTKESNEQSGNNQ